MHRLLNKRLFLSCIVYTYTNKGYGEIYILFGELYSTFCGQNINLANIKLLL